MANYLNRIKRLESKRHKQPLKQTIMTFIEEGESEEEARQRWMNENQLLELPEADWIFIQLVSAN